jgi:hypothetical protein
MEKTHSRSLTVTSPIYRTRSIIDLTRSKIALSVDVQRAGKRRGLFLSRSFMKRQDFVGIANGACARN